VTFTPPRGHALGRRAFVATLLAAGTNALVRRAQALGRTPLGGTLRLSLPFAPGPLDPHAGDDVLSALVAPALTDSLYVLDGEQNPHPALAAALPEQLPNGARVSLRAGLVTARGRHLDAKDLAWSLARARERGGAAVLAELPAPLKTSGEPLSLHFPGADAKAVAVALASPVTALVPRTFDPRTPDGTGAFRALATASSLVLERNANAARGPAFLARIEIALGGDLAEALRAFESERADVGWLGAGLYRTRAGATVFEGPSLGWVVLRLGHDAGHWSAPGVAQELLDRVPRAPLTPLGLVAPAGPTRPGAAWGGGNVELLAPAGAPQLVEIANQIAAAFSVQNQRVSVRPLAPAELVERRSSNRYALLLDFVRSVGPPGRSTLLALLAAANPALAARPPRAPSYDPLELARTLPLGVVGALHVTGARTGDVHGIESWQLGNVYLGGGDGR
jgi:peptide/nickel transport system substrate-binding protein